MVFPTIALRPYNLPFWGKMSCLFLFAIIISVLHTFTRLLLNSGLYTVYAPFFLTLFKHQSAVAPVASEVIVTPSSDDVAMTKDSEVTDKVQAKDGTREGGTGDVTEEEVLFSKPKMAFFRLHFLVWKCNIA